MRSLVQRLLGSRGYMVTRLPPEGSLEREWLRAWKHAEISLLVDIGAHVGSFGQRWRDLGFAGEIYSFEPSRRPYGELAARADESWHTFPTALGDKDHQAELHIFREHEEFSSLRMPSSAGKRYAGLTLAASEPTRVRTLDGIADEYGLLSDKAFVKIDTQGHDRSVVAGGQRFLAEAAALQVEIPMFGLYEDAPTPGTLIDEIIELGFDLVGLWPVHAHPRPIVPIEFDAVFVRTGSEPG